eukprot:scaffold17084_cov130-Isochrysis_galbana.AAC.8
MLHAARLSLAATPNPELPLNCVAHVDADPRTAPIQLGGGEESEDGPSLESNQRKTLARRVSSSTNRSCFGTKDDQSTTCTLDPRDGWDEGEGAASGERVEVPGEARTFKGQESQKEMKLQSKRIKNRLAFKK